MTPAGWCGPLLGATRPPWDGSSTWSPAAGMAGAEVRCATTAPPDWPEGTRTVVRRVRVDGPEVPVTPAPGGGAPSTRPSFDWSSAAGPTTPTPTASSSPTSRATPSRSRRGSGAGPRSKNASATPSAAWRFAISPWATRRSTPCGCGRHSWRSTCRCAASPSAASTAPAGRMPTGADASCSSFPPGCSPTPRASCCACRRSIAVARSSPPGGSCERCPPPDRAGGEPAAAALAPAAKNRVSPMLARARPPARWRTTTPGIAPRLASFAASRRPFSDYSRISVRAVSRPRVEIPSWAAAGALIAAVTRRAELRYSAQNVSADCRHADDAVRHLGSVADGCGSMEGPPDNDPRDWSRRTQKELRTRPVTGAMRCEAAR